MFTGGEVNVPLQVIHALVTRNSRQDRNVGDLLGNAANGLVTGVVESQVGETGFITKSPESGP